MADRRVKVIYEAQIANYKAAMREASRSTQDLEEKIKSTGDAEEKSAAKRGKALKTLAPAVTAVGVATVTGLGLAVKASADFDKAMSGVQASTHETADNMLLLREAAVKAGADTAFSASEAAGAIEELAKAGVSTADIMGGGLDGALALAAAGQLDVGKAAEIAASALTQFKLKGSDVGHVADLLAAGAGKAQGSVEDLGAALNQSGLVADQTGLTIEETTGGLAAFASAGLVGSDAGTSFKTMLQSLTPSSEKAAKLMDELGISAYDSQGQFIGLSEYAGVLQGALSGMSEEQRNATLKTIFGSDAVRAASVLYEQGADGIEKWEGAVNDAGYAAETAAIQQDNLAGDLEKLGGAFDTVLIQSGSGANEALRGLVQGLEGFVDMVGSIPSSVLSVGGILAGVGGGAALLGGGLITVLPKVKDTRDAIRDLAGEGSRADRAFGKAQTGVAKLGRAAGIAAVGLTTFAIAAKIAGTGIDDLGSTEDVEAAIRGLSQDSGDAAKTIDELATASGSGGAGISSLGQAIRTSQDNGFLKFLDSAGSLFGIFDSDARLATETTKRYDEALTTLVASGNLDDAAEGFRHAAEQGAAQGVALEDTAKQFPGYIDALRNTAEQAGVTVEQQDLLNWALSGIAPAAVTAAGGTDALTGAMDGASTAAAASTESQELLADRLEKTGVTTEGVVEDMQTFLDLLFQTGVLTMSSRDAASAYEAQLDSVDGVLKEIRESGGKMGATLNKNKSDFDLTTDAGRKANDTFQGLARGGMDEVRALAEEGVGQDVLQKKLKGTYTDLVSTGRAFGLTAGDARNLARKVLGVPDGVSIESWMSSAARTEADRTKSAVDRVDGTTANVYLNTYKTTFVAVKRSDSVSSGMGTLRKGPIGFESGGKLPGFDGGGQLPKTGLGVDQILALDSKTAQPVAWLDDEEWVINGANSRKYDRELAAINAGTFPKLPGYADGRAINAAPAAAGIDYNQLALAMANVQIHSQLQIEGRTLATAVGSVQRDMAGGHGKPKYPFLA